ncbi:MAG: flagellar hook-basal body complex protein FliE [Verrucomicrobia bacterium]|nr:flagellar hook-basal body complex protein FliE [Verrucomicrobiota bacterium]
MDAVSLFRLVRPPNPLSTGLPDAPGFEAARAKDLAREAGAAWPAAPGAVARPAPVDGTFDSALDRLVQGVSQKQAVARETMAGLMSGQQVPLHQAMIAMEEASVSFQLMVEVRNRLLESYQELMRMQV